MYEVMVIKKEEAGWAAGTVPIEMGPHSDHSAVERDAQYMGNLHSSFQTHCC